MKGINRNLNVQITSLKDVEVKNIINENNDINFVLTVDYVDSKFLIDLNDLCRVMNRPFSLCFNVNLEYFLFNDFNHFIFENK
jgi:hypothetical protein